MIIRPEEKCLDNSTDSRENIIPHANNQAPNELKPANNNEHLAPTEEIGRPKGKASKRPITMAGLMAAEIPPRKYIVDPIIQEKDMVEIFAAAGVGKTTFLMTLCAAIATGSPAFGKWQVPEPKSILMIDGEMTAEALKEKMSAALQQFSIDPQEVHNIAFLSRDFGNLGFSDLASEEARRLLLKHTEHFDVITFDNLSCLQNSGDENDASSFRAIRNLLLDLKAAGKASIVMHHTSKAGDKPRGTSAREDSMDTVIGLQRDDLYSAIEGASFNLKFHKKRAFVGDASDDLHFKYEEVDGIACWQVDKIVDPRLKAVIDLVEEGKAGTEIARILDISEGEVSKRRTKARALGLIKA
jgi:hypothetical protein